MKIIEYTLNNKSSNLWQKILFEGTAFHHIQTAISQSVFNINKKHFADLKETMI